MKLETVLVIAFLMISAGCSHTSNVPQATLKASIINEELFPLAIELIDENELFELTAAQKTTFLSFYERYHQTGMKKHKVIERILTHNLSNFTYFGRTYRASDAMALNQGNCMSLAILTTAFAKLINVEIDYRKMHSLPVFEKHGNVILSSSHVQSVLYDPTFVAAKDRFYFNKPSIVIDYFPDNNDIRSKKLDFNQFVAMYYVNMASEFYIKGNDDSAFVYARKANELDPRSSSALNLLALVHKNKGDLEIAEHIFQLALESDDKNVNVLGNYVDLLKLRGKWQQATLLRKKIDQVYDPNPYHWLEKAQLARIQKNYRKASQYYRKVIKMAPYIKQAYTELYSLYIQQNRLSRAMEVLKSSLPWIYEPKEKKKYKQQLYQMTAST